MENKNKQFILRAPFETGGAGRYPVRDHICVVDDPKVAEELMRPPHNFEMIGVDIGMLAAEPIEAEQDGMNQIEEEEALIDAEAQIAIEALNTPPEEAHTKSKKGKKK